MTITGLAGLAALVVYLDRGNTKMISGAVWVVDGDSLMMDKRKIRLRGIDAPELNQKCRIGGQVWACGREARAALRNKVRGKNVSCKSDGSDIYDRTLAVCSVEGIELNAWAVKSGWAIDYGGYTSEENEARRNKAGIWRGTFENPQEWRHANGRDHSNRGENMPNVDIRNWSKALKSWFE